MSILISRLFIIVAILVLHLGACTVKPGGGLSGGGLPNFVWIWDCQFWNNCSPDKYDVSFGLDSWSEPYNDIDISLGYYVHFNEDLRPYIENVTEGRIKRFLGYGVNAIAERYLLPHKSLPAVRINDNDNEIHFAIKLGWSHPVRPIDSNRWLNHIIQVDQNIKDDKKYRWKFDSQGSILLDSLTPNSVRFDIRILVLVQSNYISGDDSRWKSITSFNSKAIASLRDDICMLIFDTYYKVINKQLEQALSDKFPKRKKKFVLRDTDASAVCQR